MCQNTPQIIYYIILKMPILFHILLRLNCQTHKFMLKTHELQNQSVMSVKVNSWEGNCMFILYL